MADSDRQEKFRKEVQNMGIKPNGVATIWTVDEQARYTKVQLSTSRKSKEGMETDYSGFAMLYGPAKTKLYGNLERGTRIVLRDFEVTKKYVKEKNQSYFNISIYDADLYIPEDKEESKKSNASANANAESSSNVIPAADFMKIAGDVVDLPFE